MRSKFLLSGLLASVMIVPAFAQSATSPAMTAPSTRTEMSTPAAAHSDMWRGSKLIGVNVYNDQNEKLGDISEIMIDKAGKVAGVVIGVGGFLGMGQHDIMVDMSKLTFVDTPVRTSSTSTSTAPTATTGSATTTRTTTTADRKWYPDHAVLSGATKDQLKSMPQFTYK